MSNIVPFEAAQNSNLPLVSADMSALFGASNMGVGESIPQLSVKGKVWKIIKDGNETALMTKGEDGEEYPTPTVKVVILDTTPGRSRTFYEGSFVEGSGAKPTCHSYDGIKPASDVEAAQYATCAACPQAIKGSKITDQGNATTACSPNKLLAVVPSNKLDFDVLRLRLAITSLYDKDNPEEAKGWHAYDQYVKYLKSRGVTHTAMVETSIKFSSNVAFPKLLFKASGMLSKSAMMEAAKRVTSPEVREILGLDKGYAGDVATPAITKSPAVTEYTSEDSGVFGDDTEAKQAEAEKLVAEKAAAKVAAAKAAKAKVAAAEKLAAEKAATEAVAEADMEAETVAQTKAKPAEVDDNLANALMSWDD